MGLITGGWNKRRTGNPAVQRSTRKLPLCSTCPAEQVTKKVHIHRAEDPWLTVRGSKAYDTALRQGERRVRDRRADGMSWNRARRLLAFAFSTPPFSASEIRLSRLLVPGRRLIRRLRRHSSKHDGARSGQRREFYRSERGS
jgi:hypothetical protein